MRTILLISPYWKEDHRWMVSTVKLAELWQRLGYKVVVLCMGRAKPAFAEATVGRHRALTQNNESGLLPATAYEIVSPTLTIHRVRDFFLPDPWNYGIAFGFSGVARRLVRELKPDIIIVNKVLFWSSIALLRLRLSGYRVLLTTDALVGITWWPRGGVAKVCAAIYAWTLGWLILKFATKIVFFHPQPESTLKKLGIARKSMVIPTGIDPVPFQKPATTRSGMRVTYVGRLESVKGADDFVAAALQVKKEHPELQIRVVGWYKPNHPLVEAVKSEVEFTGLRHDIANVLAETDIFVLPSYSEGLSNALMEAMTAGRACIASDVGGNRYLIENGVSGFLFPAGDRQALASHIRRLVEDQGKRTMLGESARKRIAEKFSWETVGKEYNRIFSEWTHTQ